MKKYIVTLSFVTDEIEAPDEQEAIKIAERAASECGFNVSIKESDQSIPEDVRLLAKAGCLGAYSIIAKEQNQ